MLKDQLFKTSGLPFDNWLSGPKKVSGLPRNTWHKDLTNLFGRILGDIILFGRISGDIILFVSSKGWCLEARNFAVILIFIPFTTYEKTSFTE